MRWSLALALSFSLLTASAIAADLPKTPKGPIDEKTGWTPVSYSDDTTVFMKRDPKTARAVIRQAWTVYDSEKSRDRMGFKFMSVASLGEYDCQRRVSRTVRETFHSKPGLTGETWVQPNFVPTQWAEAGEGTVGADRMEFVCPTSAV